MSLKIKFFLLVIILISISSNGICSAYDTSKPFDLALKQIDTVVYIKVSNIEGEIVASGSGVILSEDGVIITNFHVVDKMFGANVTLTNGKTYNVEKVIGYNKELDMAILKINAKNLQYAKVGDSNSVNVGDYIMAIGNPKGLTSTVSEGIVSGIRNEKDLQQIQITAQIDHGSSGGGLFNTNGELVGITTSGYGTGNLNFCLAINQLKNLNDNPVNLSFSDLNKQIYGGKKLYEIEKSMEEKYYKIPAEDDFIYFNDILMEKDNKNNINIKVVLFKLGFDSYVKYMENYSLNFSTKFGYIKSLLEEIRYLVKVSFPDSKVNIELTYNGYSNTSLYLSYIDNIPRKFYYDKNNLEPVYELPIINIIEFNNNKTYSFFNYSFER